MAAIYLTESDVDGLLDMPLAIEVCEEAFRRLAAGEVENVPRSRAQGARNHFALHERRGALPGRRRLEELHDDPQGGAISHRAVRPVGRAGRVDRGRQVGPTAHRRDHRRGCRFDGRSGGGRDGPVRRRLAGAESTRGRCRGAADQSGLRVQPQRRKAEPLCRHDVRAVEDRSPAGRSAARSRRRSADRGHGHHQP